jgi:DnaJ-class molecular chaperone
MIKINRLKKWINQYMGLCPNCKGVGSLPDGEHCIDCMGTGND